MIEPEHAGGHIYATNIKQRWTANRLAEDFLKMSAVLSVLGSIVIFLGEPRIERYVIDVVDEQNLATEAQLEQLKRETQRDLDQLQRASKEILDDQSKLGDTLNVFQRSISEQNAVRDEKLRVILENIQEQRGDIKALLREITKP